MTTATATRRLAAILAADVVGYSRLMGADGEGTHERFKAHLVEPIDPKIREHHGWIVAISFGAPSNGAHWKPSIGVIMARSRLRKSRNGR
jgi:hypothetical protein